MDKRLERIIEKLIYWGKVYRQNRALFNETNDIRYFEGMESSRLHLLADNKLLEEEYEKITGKKVTRIGNLPDVEKMVNCNPAGMFEYVEEPPNEDSEGV